MLRFLRKIKFSEGCWEWKATTNGRGYGLFHQGKGMRHAHRVSYELFRGVIPEGLHVLHRCDNTKCVNPFHLFLGTHLENMKDRDLKGRTRKGYDHPCVKLNQQQVEEIKNLYLDGVTFAEIGKKFGVHYTTASRVAQGKNR